MMSKVRAFRLALLATVTVVSASAGVRAADDAYIAEAKAYVAKGTAPGAPWSGPTTARRRKPISW